MAQIAHGLADLGFFKESAFDALARQAERVARDGCEHDCCILLWSLALAGRLKEYEGAVNVLWDEITTREVPKIQMPNRKQLKTVVLFAESEGIKLEAGEEFRNAIDDAALYADEQGGRWDKRIAKELAGFGFEGITTEVSPYAACEGGELLKIDIAFEKERVALELDGPTHFLKSLKKKAAGEKPRRDGKTKAKTRLMKSLGWQVARLSWLNSIKIGARSEERRREFWVKKLGKFGVEPRSV